MWEETIKIRAPHWSQALREENAVLREALRVALDALATVPATRWRKYEGADDDDQTLGYRKAVEEVRRLNDAARQEVSDLLVPKGIDI